MVLTELQLEGQPPSCKGAGFWHEREEDAGFLDGFESQGGEFAESQLVVEEGELAGQPG